MLTLVGGKLRLVLVDGEWERIGHPEGRQRAHVRGEVSKEAVGLATQLRLEWQLREQRAEAPLVHRRIRRLLVAELVPTLDTDEPARF